MANRLHMVGKRTGYFPGSVNVGLVLGETGAVLIDSGLDAQTAKKIKKGLDELSLPLAAIVQTHAHADHFGGNAYLISQYPEASVYAPALEEAVMRYPLLEPIYLGAGAMPADELINKFLAAEPSRVDYLLPEEGEIVIDGICFSILALPGHSWRQVGLVADDICFAADSYFGTETLAKHKLPFLVDVALVKQSLRRLLETDCRGYLPGHGPFETSAVATIEANMECHERLQQLMENLLAEQAKTAEALLAEVCSHLEIAIGNLTSFVLYRTAVNGYLTGMLREGRIRYRLEDNCLLWEVAAASRSSGGTGG